MSITLIDRQIDRIHVIDDDVDSRDGYGLTVEELNVETILQNDRVYDMQKFMDSLGSDVGVVSDHHLKKASSYFPTNGAEFISLCYRKFIPAVLVTKYEMASFHEIRPYKKFIPVVLTPEQFTPETLAKSLVECVNEFKGNISPTRKTWRTLVRFDDVVDRTVMAILPSWNRNQIINLKFIELPEEIQKIAVPDMRIFAQVNIDTEDPYELYFSDWQIIK